jgi:uncharacterized ferritin-like protein (DUF455 family)
VARPRLNRAWSPAEAAASLAQLAYMERGLAHILAGWAVKMPAFEAKQAFGLQMHRAMERATQLRSRVNGLCHATASTPTAPGGLRAVLSRLDRAETPSLLVAGVYRWLHPRLAELYAAHLRQTDPDGDRASNELIAAFLPALKDGQRSGAALSNERGKPWIAELEALWADRLAGPPLSLDDGLWAPVDRAPAAARPATARYGPAGSLGLFPVDPLHDARDIGLLLHKELDEEYATLELVARNSYEHPDMPWAFHRDMARQASDEARHAMLILRVLTARGFRHGEFTHSKSSYDGVYAFEPCEPGSRHELLWRILIRQTFMEGLAIDHLAFEIERRRSVGQADIAGVFDYILRDEVFHAQSGLRWARELAGPDPAALAARAEAIGYFTARAEAVREAFVMENLDAALQEVAAIEAGKHRRGGALPERPLYRTGRRQAGYSDDDIGQVLAWGYAEPEPNP